MPEYLQKAMADAIRTKDAVAAAAVGQKTEVAEGLVVVFVNSPPHIRD